MRSALDGSPQSPSRFGINAFVAEVTGLHCAYVQYAASGFRGWEPGELLRAAVAFSEVGIPDTTQPLTSIPQSGSYTSSTSSSAMASMSRNCSRRSVLITCTQPIPLNIARGLTVSATRFSRVALLSG